MKPSAWKHMLFWGAGSGFILSAIFIIIISDIESDYLASIGFSNNIIYTVIISYIASMYGLIVGAISGFIIEQLLPLPLFPMTKKKQFRLFLRISPVILLVNFGISLMTIHYLLLFGKIGNSPYPLLSHWMWIVPALLSALATVLATNRYLHQLRLFSEKTYQDHQYPWKDKRYPYKKPQVTLNDLSSGVHKGKKNR